MATKKYFTEEEKRQAKREADKKRRSNPEWKERNKLRNQDPELKARKHASYLAKRDSPEFKARARAARSKHRAKPGVLDKERAYSSKYDKTTVGIRRRLKHRWVKWGIKFASEFDREIWVALALYDGTVCEVTGMTNAEHQDKYGCRLSLDHDHQTGAPRRFVARHVNTALGFLEAMTPEQITNLLRLHEEDRRTCDDIA